MSDCKTSYVTVSYDDITVHHCKTPNEMSSSSMISDCYTLVHYYSGVFTITRYSSNTPVIEIDRMVTTHLKDNSDLLPNPIAPSSPVEERSSPTWDKKLAKVLSIWVIFHSGIPNCTRRLHSSNALWHHRKISCSWAGLFEKRVENKYLMFHEENSIFKCSYQNT